MFEKLVIVALGSAGLVHVLHHGLIFSWLKERIAKYAPTHGRLPGTFKEWLAAGFMCQYCLAHWTSGLLSIFAASSLQEWALLVFSTAWIAAHSIGIFNILSGELGKSINAKSTLNWISAKRIEMEMQQQQAPPQTPAASQDKLQKEAAVISKTPPTAELQEV